MGTEQSKLTETEIKNREIQRVDSEMRRKMQKSTGTRFNMKVVLRGDRNVGKTCLLKRLQGQNFNEAYIPSESITTAHIHWNYKASDDVVVVEVWDVVDKGKERKRSNSDSLKISYSPATLNADELSDEEDEHDIQQKLEKRLSQTKLKSGAQPGSPTGKVNEQIGSHTLGVLDASIIDVYKHTNAVMFVFDITKPWTFDYVKKEIPHVPKGVNIVVLANGRDMGDKRQVHQRDIDQVLAPYGIPCIETSAKNCYGLKQLYTYFNLPYLELKVENLRQQLEIMNEEKQFAMEEINMTIRESSYDLYLQQLRDTKSKPINRVPFNEERAATMRRPVQPTTPNQPPQPNTPAPTIPTPQQQKAPPQQKQRPPADKAVKKKQETKNIEDFHPGDSDEDEEFFGKQIHSPNESDTRADTNVTTQAESSDDEEMDTDRPLMDADIDEQIEELYVTKKPSFKTSPKESPKQSKESPKPKAASKPVDEDKFYSDEEEEQDNVGLLNQVSPDEEEDDEEPIQRIATPPRVPTPVKESPVVKSPVKQTSPVATTKPFSPVIDESNIDDDFFGDEKDDDEEQEIGEIRLIDRPDQEEEEEPYEEEEPKKAPVVVAKPQMKLEPIKELLEAVEGEKKKKKKRPEGEKKKKRPEGETKKKSSAVEGEVPKKKKKRPEGEAPKKKKRAPREDVVQDDSQGDRGDFETI